jgi:hypothetical protein
MRHGAIRIAFESFEKQMLGSRLILLDRATPSVADVGGQDQGDADPRINRSRVNFQSLFESAPSLSTVGHGEGTVEQGPPAHDKIAGIGVDHLFLLDPASYSFT